MVERILEEKKTPEQIEKEKKNPLFGKPLPLMGEVDNPSYRPASWELVMTTMQQGVEANYYWILSTLSKTGHYGFECKVEKIKDIYAAGITSSFWGSAEQRKSLQQEKAMNYMATIGKMIKDLFQVVRELRVIDERMAYYEKSMKSEDKEEALSAEIALKGTWIDMVEGGAKNPASVYGLASQVGFTTLPDLFFRIFPKTTKDIGKALKQAEELGVNKKVQEILSRKLFQYLIWKEKTYAEISTRRNFILKYLRQHYNVIKMYINWLRPYLSNIRQLQMKGLEGPELASAFETSRIELELIGIKEKFNILTPEGYEESYKFEKYFPALRVRINFTAMPHMAYAQEAQRGAIHLGKAEIYFESYVVTKKDIEDYKEKKDEEDLELIASFTGAVEALGEEFRKYLKEAGELMPEKEEKKEEEKKPSLIKEMIDPFTSIFSGVRGIFGWEKKEKKEGEIKISSSQEKKEKKQAAKMAIVLGDKVYEVFKKAHGQMTPK